MNATKRKPIIKLTGKDGNAFAILANCVNAARRAKWNQEQIKEFTDAAMSGDYNNLLRTACEYFDVR